MEIVKALLVIAAALGSTWAARQTTDALRGGSPAQTLTQAQDGNTSAPTPAEDNPAPTVQEMSQEEMEAELRRAQAELGEKGGKDELKEFRPTKPLPADLPISLPSDI